MALSGSVCCNRSDLLLSHAVLVTCLESVHLPRGQCEGVLCVCPYVYNMHTYVHVCGGLDCHSSAAVSLVLDTRSLIGLWIAKSG